MYARLVSLVTLPNTRAALCSVIEDEVLPLALQQTGFFGHLTLIAEHEPRVVTVISFWRTKDDAEAYRTQIFPEVVKSLNPLLATQPKVSEFQCLPSKRSLAVEAGAGETGPGEEVSNGFHDGIFLRRGGIG
jgi:heme-degrading monooxygenase HmoA